MNLVLFTPEDLLPCGRAQICGRRARHIREIHRALPGRVLRAGLLGGRMGTAQVTGVSSDAVTFDAVTLTDAPPPKPGLHLILAVPRPKVLTRVLEASASLGISSLTLVNAARVEKSYFDSPRLEDDTVREALLRGLEQGCDTVPPTLRLAKRFRPFVEDEVPSLFGRARRLAAHPGSYPCLAQAFASDGLPPETETVAALGPEGGFVPFEIEALQAAGFKLFQMGPRILRVETAVAFIAGQAAAVRDALRAFPPPTTFSQEAPA